MGNYNSQYESYYSSMVNKRKKYNYGINHRESFKIDGNFFIKRAVRDLIGVFILFVFVLGCKLISTPQTTVAYNYSKSILEQNFDYKTAINAIKNMNAKGIENKITDWIDTTKTKIIGGKTLKERLKADFIIPVEGVINVSKDNQLKDGIDISAKAGTEILASFDGKVKECGEDNKQGKYIIIDHGGGIETKYTKLSDITLKKGDGIKKGEVIGKVEGTSSELASYLHFELSYMGESLNPEDYLNFQ